MIEKLVPGAYYVIDAAKSAPDVRDPRAWSLGPYYVQASAQIARRAVFVGCGKEGKVVRLSLTNPGELVPV